MGKFNSNWNPYNNHFRSYSFSYYNWLEKKTKRKNMKNKGLLKLISILMMAGGFGIIWFGLQGIES